ncbi:hypothetical protein LEP1GSC070_0039 [Leptospira santarosai str. AIM]|nr:hypothetical protein LEP1GSC070_0039 [Leptospira santarosai str. AIM]
MVEINHFLSRTQLIHKFKFSLFSINFDLNISILNNFSINLHL